jgi:hypothetical protein
MPSPSFRLSGFQGFQRLSLWGPSKSLTNPIEKIGHLTEKSMLQLPWTWRKIRAIQFGSGVAFSEGASMNLAFQSTQPRLT